MNKVFLAYLVIAVTIVGGHEEHMFAHALCIPPFRLILEDLQWNYISFPPILHILFMTLRT